MHGTALKGLAVWLGIICLAGKHACQLSRFNKSVAGHLCLLSNTSGPVGLITLLVVYKKQQNTLSSKASAYAERIGRGTCLWVGSRWLKRGQ